MLLNMKNSVFVAGLQKLSLIDYPGEVACVIFLAGCNMRCHYCHNSQLFELKENKIPFDSVLRYIYQNKNDLTAVVISGGEPTLCPDLADILHQIKKCGLKVKLDTNGTNFDLVKNLVAAKMVDYVALDVKASIQKHKDVTGIEMNNDIVNTVNFLKSQTAVKYMFRTTLSPILTEDDIAEIGKDLINGADTWQLQQFVPNEYSHSHKVVFLPHSKEKIAEFAEIAKKYAQNVVVRGM
jgi:pyruvate formate lyase activating enzyme